jgi:alpha-galactosidase
MMNKDYDAGFPWAIRILRSNRFAWSIERVRENLGYADYRLNSLTYILMGLAFMTPVVASSQCSPPSVEIVAAQVEGKITLDAEYPAPEWQRATPVTFCRDWQGNNPDEQRQTQVRVLWSSDTLYLRFECRYRELFVYEDSDPDGRRDLLWERDVAETFLQPDPSQAHYYREFEVSPNGMWVDLDIFPGGRADLKSGMRKSVFLDKKAQVWSAELAIPMKALTDHFDPTSGWKANFFRVEGKEPRTYMSWRPTNSPQPNFHVPEAFGELRFAATLR